MSGVLSVLVSGGNLAFFSVTLGDTGTSYGYSASGAGSISPSDSLLGDEIRRIDSEKAADVFNVELNAVVDQTLFSSIRIQKSDGSFQTLESASATFTSPGGTRSLWSWELSGGAVGTVWTSSGSVRTVEFH